MPAAGTSPQSRQYAHLKWAQRYNDAGEVDKAASHLGRALHYGEAANDANGKHQASFGTRGAKGPQSSGARGPQGPAKSKQSSKSAKSAKSAKRQKSRKSAQSSKSSEEEDPALESWDKMRRKYRYFGVAPKGNHVVISIFDGDDDTPEKKDEYDRMKRDGCQLAQTKMLLIPRDGY